MTTIERLRAELARYTYKPGWTLSIEPNGYGTLELWVSFVAPDSRDPAGKEIVIPSGQRVPGWLIEGDGLSDAFPGWLARALIRIEEHESQEWLRRDSALVKDPHADGRRSL